LNLERHLGNGSFGSVDLVKEKKTNELYALKKIPFSTTEQRDTALKEAKLLQGFDHPNVGTRLH